ncbi:ABC transporter permease [bacterium]|nr:ABC transporter permease [bacterium]MCI0566277.1 ABC transporter permease [bacterium]MCI0679968.1 ABC transporter permease [bacterium]
MFSKYSQNVRIGFFLATKSLRRANPWTTGLIIFVMVLTFLNLVVVSGILVGLIEGSIREWHEKFTGDVIISALDDKKYIENSPNLIALVSGFPEIEAVSPRYSEGAVLEANYKTKKETEKPNTAGVQIFGIDPESENNVTGLAAAVTEGEYLSPDDYDEVIIGQFLLSQYVPVEDPNFAALHDVGVGTKIRMTVGSVTREVTVKGIIKSKVDALTRNVFMVDSQFRSMIGRTDGNVDQIAVLLKDGADPVSVREKLKRSGVERFAKVQTYADAQPKFLKDIINTFNMLGAAFSSIGLVVASITIFIVVFINAITRRKFIGIMKGIGIEGSAIRLSYVFQSIFYALVGSIIGLVIVYGFLIPLIDAHPINFPFSDGILVAPLPQTFFRIGLLVFATVIAGFIPAWMIIRKNTLDSILGRN